jgi:perosamine synthetase
MSIERITHREKKYVLEVLDSQFRTSMGSMMTKRLEEKFAEKFQSKFAISFINGTATMHAALHAAGIGPGDEVIVPPLTMASTSFAVLHAGATPVFADIDPDCWTIDPASIKDSITKRTKAIIPVAIYGLLPDFDRIMDLAQGHNLFVLEDDAQCFLGHYKGKIGGSIGHAASFSFQSSKQMTSGEGGMITTNDEALADSIRRFNSLGYASVKAGAGKGKISKDVIQDPNYERHASIGWNYRMSELCAAVALGQLEHLDELVDMRKKIAAEYAKITRDCSWLTPQKVPRGYDHSYWTFVVKLDNDNRFSWYDFRKKYMELGGDGIYGAWQLTYLEPAFREKQFDKNQTQVFRKGLCRHAENVQPKLLQFKTNYFSEDRIHKATEALGQSIEYFNKLM